MRLKKINIAILKFSKSKNFRKFYYIFLLFIVGIMNVQITYNNRGKYSNYEYSLLYELIIIFFITTSIIYLNIKVLVPMFLMKKQLTKYVFIIGLCVIGILVAIITSQNLFFNLPYNNNIKNVLLNIEGNIISISLVIISTSIFSLFREWQENIQQINKLETATIEIELKQLKNQINPHFLFNTINNANIKVEKDPYVSYSIITKLENMLHYQLTITPNSKIKIKSDITFLTDYLELEKTRRNSFFYKIIADESIYNLVVFPLLFIPFVENAVKHSLTTKEKSTIIISFLKENDSLHFTCENSKPLAPIKQKSGGLGLKNIKRRLELLYGDTYSLETVESNEKYTVNLYLKI